MRKVKILVLVLLCGMGLVACDSDADVVTENIKKDAEQFRILRRIVFINNITGEYLFQAEGNCSVETNNEAQRLEVTCKLGKEQYKVHYFGLSDNTSYTVEQLDWADSNKYRYEIVFKPESIVPLIEND
ncbi:hypothetical protein A4S06_09195 [Erysipelotrichaceae bacterium MTC7]|nr:hypothetical protein A4S06_09195 [Erysipelotrichaceae bacterium MTC7]